MDKAFDVKALIEKAKAKGGPDAEKLLEKNWEALTEWLLESAALSENAIVKAAVPLAVPVLDGVVRPALNQVDGQAG